MNPHCFNGGLNPRGEQTKVMKLADTIAKSSPALMMTLLLGSFISTIAVMILGDSQPSP